MEQTMKEAYVAPSIEVIEMENEGCVMTASGGVGGGFGNEGSIGKSVSNNSYNSRTRNGYSASSSVLEDMINDILTIEN